MEDEKTVSLAESSQLSISKLISKVLNDGHISDAEINLILWEVEQYHLRSEGKEMASQGVDVEAIKQEIKKINIKKARVPAFVNIKH